MSAIAKEEAEIHRDLMANFEVYFKIGLF